MNTPKIFGQLKPSNTEDASMLYEVTNNTRAQITVFVCNQSDSVELFRIALVPANTTLIAARYIAYDSPLAANGVFSVSGIGLNAGDAIWVKSQQGALSFTATGIEFV